MGDLQKTTQKEREEPTLLSIRDTIAEDFVAVRKWDEVKDYFFLKDSDHQTQISTLVERGQGRSAIKLTLQSWIEQEKQKMRLADLVKILRGRELNAVSDKLEAKYQSGDILLHPASTSSPIHSTHATSQFLQNSDSNKSKSSKSLRVIGGIIVLGGVAFGVLLQYYFIEHPYWNFDEPQRSAIPEPLFGNEVIMGTKEEPSVIVIRDVIAAEPVALGDWGVITDYLVTDPTKVRQIRGLLKDHEYKRAIQLTLEVWVQEKAKHTLVDLVKVLRSQRLGALSDELEARFDSGPILM